MTEPVRVTVERLPHGADLPLPAHATPGSSGVDLLAAASVSIAPGRFAAVPTGIRIALPPGLEAQVRPRSGLAARHGVTVLNAPGTIDCDYRGELKVLLVNTDPTEDFQVRRGERIAQLVIQRVEHCDFVAVDELPSSTRGEGGFGSTGR